MNNIFFTSDTHFGSKRTVEYSKRPFKNVNEHDHALIKAINELPKNSDLYHVGDWGDMVFIKAIRSDIKVHLVMGNWDEYEQRQSGLDFDEWKTKMLDMGFASIYPNPIVFPLTKKLNVWLCHKPSQRNTGMFNLFGHIHRAYLTKRNGINVGVDQHQYKPISVDDVLFWKEAIEKHFDAEEWLD